MSEKELRELDAWIAEHVMGWRIHTSGRRSIVATRDFDGPNERTFIIIVNHPWDTESFNPTTDPAAAMEVLKKCIGRDENVEMWQTDSGYWVAFPDRRKGLFGSGKTLELAIAVFAKKLFSK